MNPEDFDIQRAKAMSIGQQWPKRRTSIDREIAVKLGEMAERQSMPFVPKSHQVHDDALITADAAHRLRRWFEKEAAHDAQ